MGDKDGKTYRSKLLEPCESCKANGLLNCRNPWCHTNIKELEESKEKDDEGECQS